MSTSSGWDDHRLTCMHGIREGLDSHDCPHCYALANEVGADTSDGKTYLYRRDPRPASVSGGSDAS
jgi:hypothetical protein